jgi:hypothetical protein
MEGLTDSMPKLSPATPNVAGLAESDNCDMIRSLQMKQRKMASTSREVNPALPQRIV